MSFFYLFSTTPPKKTTKTNLKYIFLKINTFLTGACFVF